jgi:hypothetical protein
VAPIEAVANSLPAQISPQAAFSNKQAVWLLIRLSEDLDETQQQTLTLMSQSSLELEGAYQVTQAFTHMLRQQ